MKQEVINEDLELANLGQYHGTQGYANVMGANVTDGICYVMQNGYSWLVTDFIIVARMKPKLKAQPFLTIDLKIDGKCKTLRAKMVVTDGNNNVLYEQKYGWTSAKKEFRMFFTDNVLMLSREY